MNWTAPNGMTVRKPLTRKAPLRSRQAAVTPSSVVQRSASKTEGGRTRKRSTARPAARDRVPAKVMAALYTRSRGICERCEKAVACDPQHRVNRGMGGSKRSDRHRLSNLLHICRVCHDLIHAFPQRALELGLSVSRYQNPAVVPVTLGIGPNIRRVLLGDDGTTRPVED